ncbi:hypothetical protein MLD38_028480 [Melastoma candidum]|uniref:Uncharacterized protein n=1 Tax=Melastoma candidum TaxID=119954 RepID=A0ACB9N0W1_9MYRT|nr:hypothetical protein MLD38_028480 [Melastoma candidum]
MAKIRNRGPRIRRSGQLIRSSWLGTCWRPLSSAEEHRGCKDCKKRNQGWKPSSLEDVKGSLEEETRTLREKVEILESDLAAKVKDVNTAEARAISLSVEGHWKAEGRGSSEIATATTLQLHDQTNSPAYTPTHLAKKSPALTISSAD